MKKQLFLLINSAYLFGLATLGAMNNKEKPSPADKDFKTVTLNKKVKIPHRHAQPRIVPYPKIIETSNAVLNVHMGSPELNRETQEKYAKILERLRQEEKSSTN